MRTSWRAEKNRGAKSLADRHTEMRFQSQQPLQYFHPMCPKHVGTVSVLFLPGRLGRCGPVQPWLQSSGQQPGLSSSLLPSWHSSAGTESSAAHEPWPSTLTCRKSEQRTQMIHLCQFYGPITDFVCWRIEIYKCHAELKINSRYISAVVNCFGCKNAQSDKFPTTKISSSLALIKGNRPHKHPQTSSHLFFSRHYGSFDWRSDYVTTELLHSQEYVV